MVAINTKFLATNYLEQLAPQPIFNHETHEIHEKKVIIDLLLCKNLTIDFLINVQKNKKMTDSITNGHENRGASSPSPSYDVFGNMTSVTLGTPSVGSAWSFT
jgi:hypothetical protein